MNNIQEKRRYIRLNTVFPIEFQVVDKEDRRPISELYEGFTRDIGKGGMGIFSKTLKDKDKERFNFVPHETKLKIIINIPLDKEPIGSFATVEWVERQPGPIVDTYMFGISYDFINELEYEKIISYVRWLRLRPRLISFVIAFLAIAFVLSSILLFRLQQKRTEGEKQLLISLSESKRAKAAQMESEKKRSEAEGELETAKNRHRALQSALEKVLEKKRILEEMSKLSEDDKKDLQLQIEGMEREKASLEERIGGGPAEGGEEAVAGEAVPGAKEESPKISDEQMRAEEPNYDKFRELILNEKIQSLSAYIAAHRSSIYHASALFALAELRYKHGERALAAVSYNQVIEFYPKSKYALYSSHRL